ncbi:hypothetical protein [Caballeronia sp. DA-9]|uniref:hypothetical protein n=1 Tax=Caballeronia sp. DA-9 TaxID=3436237 RepID=UPI003F665194
MKMTIIDAKERPIAVASDGKRIYVCPDKSPDALSQLATSGDLKITLANGAGAGLDAATAEQATSLAFRTGVTETQQVFLYFLCQFNADGTISDYQVSSEMNHYQNTLLGMLAIEELTGTVRPLAAAPDSAASTKGHGTTTSPNAPDPANSKAAVTKGDSTGAANALVAVTSAKRAVDSPYSTLAAQTNIAKVAADAKQFNDALSLYGSKEGDFSAAVNQLETDVKALPNAGDAPTAVTQALNSLDSQKTTVATDQKNVAAAVQKLQTATDVTGLQAAQTGLTTAYNQYKKDDATYLASLQSLQKGADSWNTQTVAKMTGDGTKSTDPASTQKTTNASSGGTPIASSDVAAAVTEIVQTVVWQSFITENCLDALFHPDEQKPLPSDMRTYCINHLQEADAYRFAQLGLTVDVNGHVSVIPGFNQNSTSGDGPAKQPLQQSHVAHPVARPRVSQTLHSGDLGASDLAPRQPLPQPPSQH